MTQTVKPLDVGKYTPPEGKGKAFVAKHTVATIDDEDPKGDTETQHKADNVKTFDRAKNLYGYAPGEDATKYEETENGELVETIYLDAKRMDDGAFSTKYGFSKQHFVSKIEMPARKMRDHIKNGKIVTAHYYEHVEIFDKLPRKGA